MTKAAVRNLLRKAKTQKRSILTEFEAKQVLSAYGIPITKGTLVTKKEEAGKIAAKIGFPIVMKVVSPEIVHKTEAGVISVGLKTVEEVEQAFEVLPKNARAYKKNAKIHGILIQEMAKGREVIVGSIKDPQFGPVLMFGLGGILVEVMKDVAFRVIPIEKNDAFEIIQEIKGYKILQGVRGKKPVNFNALANVLLKVSQLISENPDIKELDINPLFVNEKEVKAADARIILE